ncbi:TMEM165/GDT1 family protein [Brevundimonas sp.]|uniref:TMEM165/GDT1 family protein n=1 Tax=Brevundimonas sp. TaxID=1871086 RepID=UPI0025DCDF77|nr:TMEM165/GDT1 family protein [Brevundimonas sp.]
MDALIISTGLVAVAEISDKTMLLAICLAAAWRRPSAILAGILLATLANHALAGAVGFLAAHWFEGTWMRWVLGALFLAFAAWALIPDTFDDCPPDRKRRWASVLWTTTTAFFLVEMGDKTQIATAALAARFAEILPVVAGSTLGMVIANAPAVLLGQAAADRLPLNWIRFAAAAAFAATGLWVLIAG